MLSALWHLWTHAHLPKWTAWEISSNFRDKNTGETGVSIRSRCDTCGWVRAKNIWD